MINYITGSLVWCGLDAIIVDNQGIGYRISMPGSMIDRLPVRGSEIKVYTYLHVREDLMQLFGFLSMDDLEVFQMLITVNGIGPKAGLAILSMMTPDELRFAVMADDAKSIAKTPGIGAKTAGKLILELKDKLKIQDVVSQALDRGVEHMANGEDTGDYSSMVSEATEALVALGYSTTEAMKAVRSVEKTEDMTVEKLLKWSLKQL